MKYTFGKNWYKQTGEQNTSLISNWKISNWDNNGVYPIKDDMNLCITDFVVSTCRKCYYCLWWWATQFIHSEMYSALLFSVNFGKGHFSKVFTQKGGCGCLMYPPCLELYITLFSLPFCSSTLSCFSFRVVIFSANGPFFFLFFFKLNISC